MAAGAEHDSPIVRVFELVPVLLGKMHKSTCYRFHPKPLVQATVSSDGTQFCSLTQDGKVRSWNEYAKAPNLVASFNGTPTAILWTDFGIFIGMKDGNLHKVLIGRGILQTNKFHTSVSKICLANDPNRLLLVKLTDGQVFLFDTNSGQKLRKIAEVVKLVSVDPTSHGTCLYLDIKGLQLHTLQVGSSDLPNTVRLGSPQSAACFLSGSEGLQILVGNGSGILQRLLVSRSSGSNNTGQESVLGYKPVGQGQIRDLQLKIDRVDARLGALLAETQRLDQRTQENTDLISMMWAQAKNRHTSDLLNFPAS